MAVVISGDGPITGVSSVNSAAANKAVVLGDSGSNTNSCRAWVNFNGTGTVEIRAAFNVSSITDLNAGLYYVNFSTAMPDVNYGVNALATNGTTMGINDGRRLISAPIGNYTTGYFYIGIVNTAGTAFIDASVISVAIFR